MRGNLLQTPDRTIRRGIARAKLLLEVNKFVIQLARGNTEVHAVPAPVDFGWVETVASAAGFSVYFTEIGRNRRGGSPALLESLQLRMRAVTGSAATEDRLRQQRFAPQRHQPLGVE